MTVNGDFHGGILTYQPLATRFPGRFESISGAALFCKILKLIQIYPNFQKIFAQNAICCILNSENISIIST